MSDPRPDAPMESPHEHQRSAAAEHAQAPEKDAVGLHDPAGASSGSEGTLAEKPEPEQHDEHHRGGAKGGKRELTEHDAPEVLAYAWPAWKKWMYLSAVAGIQISMNYNTSVFPSAIPQLSETFGIDEQGARVGQMIYLVMYSFGCELWAPWSEEFGRWPILQLSMLLINIWQIPCALAPNWGTIVVCRALVSRHHPQAPRARVGWRFPLPPFFSV